MSVLPPLYRMVLLFCVLCALPVAAAHMTPADKDMYEKLGLSETEWGMVLDSHMSLSKVKYLLKSGISIAEYFRSPWKDLGLSEEKWIGKRQSGLSDNDMRAKAVKPEPSGNVSYIGAFFLPGCFQFSRGQTAKGWIMAGAAVVFITLCVAHSVSSKHFQPLGLVLLVPDMIWSGIDIGVQINREENPDASRFSSVLRADEMAVSLQVTMRY
jgi:hypothetical protein